LYSKISENCKKVFEEKFTAQVMTRNTEKIYMKVLEEK